MRRWQGRETEQVERIGRKGNMFVIEKITFLVHKQELGLQFISQSGTKPLITRSQVELM